MNCEQARQLIDAYIDGELTQEEKRALMNHVQACDMCALELENAELLRDTLAHLDEEVDVPLEVQAAWRSAVRAEAKKKNTKKWMRMGYAVAAAFVLLLGGVFAMQDMPSKQNAVMEVDELAVASELIARDGMARTMPEAGNSVSEYSAWKKISSEAPEKDLESLKMLAEEYNADCIVQSSDICRIEISREYMDDFLNAASRIGKELSLETMYEDTKPDAVIIFQFCEE